MHREVESRRNVSRVDQQDAVDRKSTRLNSSHSQMSYAVFCLKKKKVAAEVATATSADTKRFVRAEAQRLLGSLHVAEQDIALTRDAVRLAGEDLPVIQARYHAGIATILDVLTSQTALIQAELDLVSARFSYQVARASLEALLGRDL